MISLTEMERQVLGAFVKDDFCENGLDSSLWADVFLDTIRGYCGIESKVARGVLSSLVKKGVIRGFNHIQDRFGRNDDAITLTESGKKLMRELGYND